MVNYYFLMMLFLFNHEALLLNHNYDLNKNIVPFYIPLLCFHIPQILVLSQLNSQ